jgi:hypothetical protein
MAEAQMFRAQEGRRAGSLLSTLPVTVFILAFLLWPLLVGENSLGRASRNLYLVLVYP